MSVNMSATSGYSLRVWTYWVKRYGTCLAWLFSKTTSDTGTGDQINYCRLFTVEQSFGLVDFCRMWKLHWPSNDL